MTDHGARSWGPRWWSRSTTGIPIIRTSTVLRGRDDLGEGLILPADYLTDGMRLRAGGLSTEWLRLSPERKIQARRLQRDVEDKEGGGPVWTGELHALRRATAPSTWPGPTTKAATRYRHRSLLLGRLQVLAGMGLAREQHNGLWQATGDRRPSHDASGRWASVATSLRSSTPSAARSAARTGAIQWGGCRKAPPNHRGAGSWRTGYLDELDERAYVIVDGMDGRAHHV